MTFLAQLGAWDERLSARLVLSPQAQVGRLVALVAAHSGDSLLALIAAGAALVWGGLLGREVGLRLIVGTAAAGLVATVLKRLIRRRRPAGKRGALYASFDRHGFPSGHASRGAALVVLLAPLFFPGGLAALLFWAALVGWARTALGIHYPSDIVGGWVIGAATGAGALMMLRLLA